MQIGVIFNVAIFYSCTFFIPIVSQNQNSDGLQFSLNILEPETSAKYLAGLSRNRNKKSDEDSIVFRDDDDFGKFRSSQTQNSRIYTSETKSTPRPSISTQLANSNKNRWTSEDDSISFDERRVESGRNNRRRSQKRHPLNRNTPRDKNNNERTSITSYSNLEDSGRRKEFAENLDPSRITFPQEYRTTSSRRRPSHKQNSPSQFQKPKSSSNENQGEGQPLAPTGSVPYSYLYKWIKQYHKQP